MSQEAPHKLTPLTILVVFVLTIPGLVIGQLISLVYGWFIGSMAGDSLFNWISAGWFHTIVMAIIPNALSGAIAGYFGIRVTFTIKYLKQANYEIAAYAMSAIIVALTVFLVFVALKEDGMSIRVVELVSNTAGLVGGLFGGYQSVAQDQRRAMRMDAPALSS